ncbi:hypothetical protein DFH08DRAFT_950658 [Mycena albidolilacea]|uniref:Uncharacterized protein n=1 Tax=Mycena albidolilacea TaxID=1033008 RepID=A0AAD7ALL1_9AGAR|nr:hypothetical protein DFH08DRAFT_950658 [Mycena albidolilacea]
MPFLSAPANVSYAKATKETHRVETKCRHTFKVATKSLGVVQELELKLGIITHWELGSKVWVKAAKMTSSCRYQLDQLQGLVVARMFELSKVNMLGTSEFLVQDGMFTELGMQGYKLHKHIAKVLQAHLKSMRTIFEHYSMVASVMTLPKRLLAWDEVVGYAFLTEFELLQ